MSRKYWLFFAVVQALGLLGYFEAIYLLQDGLLWLVSLFLLLPGSLVFLPGMLYGVAQPDPPHVVEMPVLPLYVATFAVNIVFFYFLLRLLIRRRNAKFAGLPHAASE
jgi:hypothetical protein